MGGIVALLMVSVLTGVRKTGADKGRLHLVCSFLPVYVFTLNVVGDTPGVQVELLAPPDVGCVHDYAVRPADLKRVSRADAVIANGLDAEPFLPQLLSGQDDVRLITLSAGVSALPAGDPGHGHEESHADPADHEQKDAHAHHGHEHCSGEHNPHVWVSPLQAAQQVRTLARELAKLDPEHADAYTSNAEAYAGRLEDLARRMKAAAQAFANRKIVTFHDAFAYLARDLDLEVVATLTVDPESGPSAGELKSLIEVIQREKPAAIFYEPAYSDRTAKTVSEETGLPAYPLNPFNYFDGEPKADAYEAVMSHNLEVLQKALEGRF